MTNRIDVEACGTLAPRRAWVRVSLASSLAALLLVCGCANGTEVGSPGTSNDGGLGAGPGGDEDPDGSGNVIPGDDDGGVIDPDDPGGNSSKDDAGGGDPDGKDAGGTDPIDPVGCTGKIVINEVMPEGASNNEEFIELYNPNDCAVNVGKWKIFYQSKSGSTPEDKFTFAANKSIDAKAFFLVGTNTISGKHGSFGGGLGNAGGQIALVNNGNQTIDSVGFGSTTKGPYVEGKPTVSVGAGQSVARIPDGHDTDDNAADFKKFDTPTPGKANK